MNGYAVNGMTNTEMGDRVEAALWRTFGWEPLNGSVRQGAFDLRAPDGALVEVKACSAGAAEWKVKSKARELLAKMAHAERMGATAATVIAVVYEDGSALIFRREGLGCFRLSKASVASGNHGPWSLVGEVTI